VDKINPDVFVAVAAIAWADGKTRELKKSEKE